MHKKKLFKVIEKEIRITNFQVLVPYLELDQIVQSFITKLMNKSNRTLKKGDLYLVDSGGQYNFGTTDVTRTLSL